MRWLFVVGLTGCFGDGFPQECETDRDCDEVCARNHECADADEVRAVRVTWTLSGRPANDATCASARQLAITFYGPAFDDQFGFSPVPCSAGLFSVDKIPKRFDAVDLGKLNVGATYAKLDASGTAAIDLPY